VIEDLTTIFTILDNLQGSAGDTGTKVLSQARGKIGAMINTIRSMDPDSMSESLFAEVVRSITE